MKNKIRPLGGNVVVKQNKAEDKTPGGIFLPQTATKETPKRGKVVALGEGTYSPFTGNRKAWSFDVGSEVLFNSYRGSEIKIGDEELLLLTDEDILAVVE